MNIKSNLITKSIILFFLITLIIFSSGCQNSDEGLGTIQGNVIITESCNSGPCKISQKELLDIYSTRRLMLYSQETEDKVRDIKILNNGTFTVKILPGEYFIDLLDDNFDKTYDLPKQIIVEANKVNNVDINIEIQKE